MSAAIKGIFSVLCGILFGYLGYGFGWIVWAMGWALFDTSVFGFGLGIVAWFGFSVFGGVVFGLVIGYGVATLIDKLDSRKHE